MDNRSMITASANSARAGSSLGSVEQSLPQLAQVDHKMASSNERLLQMEERLGNFLSRLGDHGTKGPETKPGPVAVPSGSIGVLHQNADTALCIIDRLENLVSRLNQIG